MKHVGSLFFSAARAYIRALKDATGRPVLEGLKKTGFVGFLVCMESVEKLFDDLVSHGPLRYLLTHKMSQDHAETFFGCIRGRGGFNNNPTATQFIASYKRHLVQTEVKSSTSGNCSQDIVSILGATALVSAETVSTAVTAVRRSPVLQPEDHDYTHRVDYPESLSPCVTSVVPYIAGFVARKVIAVTTCEDCITALESESLPPLVKPNSRGGPVAPSQNVNSLCEMLEKGLRRLQNESASLKTVHIQAKHLILEVLSLVSERKWFSQLDAHLLDCDLLDHHIYNLCKQVAEQYVRIRLHHMAKEHNREITKDKVRPVLSRLIIFKNQ